MGERSGFPKHCLLKISDYSRKHLLSLSFQFIFNLMIFHWAPLGCWQLLQGSEIQRRMRHSRCHQGVLSVPRWLEDREKSWAGPGSNIGRTVQESKARAWDGQRTLLGAHGSQANPKEAGPPWEGVSKPADGSGTLDSYKNKNQAIGNGISKAAVWGVVGRKWRPKIKPKLVRSEHPRNQKKRVTPADFGLL